MAKLNAAFLDATRRAILGEWHELKTLPGYGFAPRKFSSHGSAEIEAIGTPMQRLPDEILDKIAELSEKADDANFEDVFKELPRADRRRILRNMSSDASESVRRQRATLTYGIGLHNFFENGEGKREKTEEVTEELIDGLMDVAGSSVVAEMIEVIKGHNSPLAESRGGK